MFVKACSVLANVASVVTLGFVIAVAAMPTHRPTPAQASNFQDFADRYAEADADYRLDAFQKKVVGEKVDWVGVVESASHTGKSIYITTLPTSHFHAFVVLNQDYPLKNLKPGITYVRVKGRIDRVSVLGPIVEGCIVEEIY